MAAAAGSAGTDILRCDKAAEENRRRKRRLRRRELKREFLRSLELQIHDDKPKEACSGDSEAAADGEECADLEPFFFDEAEAVAEHERQIQREKEEELQHKKLMAARDRIQEYDPKQGDIVYTRIYFVDLMEFDHDEESPLGPMRGTGASIDMVDGIVCKEGTKQLDQGDESANNALSMKSAAAFSDVCKEGTKQLDQGDESANNALGENLFVPCNSENLFVPCNSANVFSVKIVSSDVGFPIEVYGTIVARDMLDRKCVYLFCRDRDHSQLILTKNEDLTLIGPKRGLALIDAIYFEIDLKIKGEGKQKKDKKLSKGYLALDGVRRRHFTDKIEVESYSLESMLSQVVVTCGVEKGAVEATIAIEIVQGKFYGEITACTTNNLESIMLYDSRLLSAAAMTGRELPIQRRVVAVGLMDKLIVTVTRLGVCKTERQGTIKFTPRVNGSDEDEISCGTLKVRVKVTWSIIARMYLHYYKILSWWSSSVVRRPSRPCADRWARFPSHNFATELPHQPVPLDSSIVSIEEDGKRKTREALDVDSPAAARR